MPGSRWSPGERSLAGGGRWGRRETQLSAHVDTHRSSGKRFAAFMGGNKRLISQGGIWGGGVVIFKIPKGRPLR